MRRGVNIVATNVTAATLPNLGVTSSSRTYKKIKEKKERERGEKRETPESPESE